LVKCILLGELPTGNWVTSVFYDGRTTALPVGICLTNTWQPWTRTSGEVRKLAWCLGFRRIKSLFRNLSQHQGMTKTCSTTYSKPQNKALVLYIDSKKRNFRGSPKFFQCFGRGASWSWYRHREPRI